MVLGLDVSTKTGWSVQCPLCDKTGQKEFVGCTGMARVLAFSDWFVRMTEEHQPELVVFEDFAGPVYTLRTIMEIGTVMRLMCHIQKVRWIEIAPTSLKKFVSGNGNSKKSEMMLHVYKRWHFDPKSDNEADAYGLARLGSALLGWEKGLTDFQKAVVEQVRKSKGFVSP